MIPGRRGGGRPVRRRPCRSTRGGRRWPVRPTTPAPWWATTSAGSPTRTTWRPPPSAGATVVATHIRLRPRMPDPEPRLRRRGRRCRLPGRAGRTGPGRRASPPDRIVIDAGLDLGKTARPVALALLRASDRLADLGLPAAAVGLDDKTFLGVVLGPGSAERRGATSLAATALGAALGCRVMRVHERGRPPPGLCRPGRHHRGEAGERGRHRHRPPPAYLVKGSDPSLVAQAAHALVERLVDGGDPSMMVEEFGGPGVDQFDVGAVIDACTTPPFLVDRRVVVVREAGQIGAADAKRIVAYLADPLGTTSLVLVAGGGALAPALTKAVGASGEVVDTSVGTGKARTQWLSEHLRGGPVRLDGPAQARLGEHLGSDMGRLAGLLDTLSAAYGQGATVTAADLEPFLGEAGALAPWDLTDAIDAGTDGPGARGAAPDADGGGVASPGDPGAASQALPPDAAPRRVGGHLARAGGGGAGDQERLPGEEGTGAGQPARVPPGSPVRSSYWPRPISTSAARPGCRANWWWRCSWPDSAVSYASAEGHPRASLRPPGSWHRCDQPRSLPARGQPRRQSLTGSHDSTPAS